ncbi:hypothetical protein [Saccharothrix lopnurensis]|uniref:Uncharacterized protein n=1 Tax=Saccharothrix lopnurensis TaxID=1670621 RepID=A0ABW1NZU7_9PSEU
MTRLDEHPAVEPLWSPEEFADIMRELAREEAPRLFAIVEEYGDRVDARVAGYGVAFAGRVDANSVEGNFPLRTESAEGARKVFEIGSRPRGVRVHLVWLDDSA